MTNALRPWLQQRWRTLGVLSCVVTFIFFVGWMSGASNAPPADRAVTNGTWALPDWELPDNALLTEQLAAQNRWGKPPAAATGVAVGEAAPKPLTRPDWKILGTAVTNDDRAVLVRVGNEPVREFRANETLPGGAVIKAIESDRLYLIVDGKKRILRVYKE